MDQNSLSDDLLSAWIRATTSIRNEKFTHLMPYNESLICNLLLNAEAKGEAPLTATHLCNVTQIQKSQMNRTLTNMEAAGLITRERSTQDGRQILVSANKENFVDFYRQHKRIMAVVDGVVDRLGPEETQKTIEVLCNLSDVIEDLVNPSDLATIEE